MSDFKVKHYRTLRSAVVYKVDSYYNIAAPIMKGGDRVYIKKDREIRSLGETKRLMLQSREKMDFLILVNGDAIKLSDVEFIKQDDKCCEGAPDQYQKDATADYTSEAEKKVETKPDKSAFLNKSRFDKGMMGGAILGAVLLGGVMWFTTHNKVKTMVGIVAGAVIGGIIGRFMGRRGENKLDQKVSESDAEKEVSESVSSAKPDAKDASKELFLQVGNTYAFNLVQPSFVLTYNDETFSIAKGKDGKKMKVQGPITGKIIESFDPILFILGSGGSISKSRINKPLPFIEIGKNLYVPMAFIEPSSVINADELKAYLAGNSKLEEEVYVKGRYAGKKFYYLAYIPK